MTRKLHLTRRWVSFLVWLARPVVATVMFAFRFIPEQCALALACPIGRLTRIGKKQEILARLQLTFKSESFAGAGIKKFWRDHVAHLGRSIIEPIYFYYLPDDKLVERVTVTGEEHLRHALVQGRGAILFLNHLGNPGAIVAGLGLRGYDLTIAGNALVATIAGEEVPLRYLESVVQRMFARGHVHRALLGDRLPQRVTETLARNALFAMFIDFPVGRKHNQAIAFGDVQMNANLGPAILALRHRAAVMCVTCLRVGENRHQLTIHPPLETPSASNINEAASDLLKSALKQLETDLRQHPDQWWPWDWAQISPRK